MSRSGEVSIPPSWMFLVTQSWAGRVRLWEGGAGVYITAPPEGSEERHLGILLWGNSAPSAHWRSNNRITLRPQGTRPSVITSASFKLVEETRLVLTVEIWRNEERIGFAGQVVSERTKTIGATHPVLFAELNIDSVAHLGVERAFSRVDKFPAVTRDIAFVRKI